MQAAEQDALSLARAAKLRECCFGKDSFIAARLKEKDTFSTYVLLSFVYLALIGMALRHHTVDFDPEQHNMADAIQLICLPIILLAASVCQVAAMRCASERNTLRITKITQFVSVVVTLLRVLVVLKSVKQCPQTSDVVSVPLHCNTSQVPEANLLHIQFRVSTAMYSAVAIQPIHLMLHMVPVLPVIVPFTFILFIFHVVELWSHISIQALLYPSVAGIFILVQGFRSEMHLQTIFQQKQQIIDEHAAHEQEKDEWMAGVGHNIGTPLTSIVLANEAIATLYKQENCSTIDVSHLTTKIRVATDYIRVIYTTLMRGLRIQDDITCRHRRFSARDFLAQCEAITRAYGAAHPGVEVSYTMEITGKTAVPTYLVMDHAKLQQCVVNLVSNAQKFTKEGMVQVIVMKVGDEDSMLRISVIDTGVGVKNDLLPTRIFKQQTGLGLQTVWRFVKSMGGECLASNNASGIGATFCVEIPLCNDIGLEDAYDDHSTLVVREASLPIEAVAVSSKVAEKNGLNDKNVSEKKAVPNDYSPAMKRVLVVDDQEFNRAIIMQMISDRFNVELQGAGDGVEALAIMSASPTFDVILMDLQMPRMSGEACFERIVQIYGNVDRPRVIVLTAKDHPTEGALKFDAWWDKSNPSLFLEMLKEELDMA